MKSSINFNKNNIVVNPFAILLLLPLWFIWMTIMGTAIAIVSIIRIFTLDW